MPAHALSSPNHYAQVTPEFSNLVNFMKAQIMEQMTVPMEFNGHALTGGMTAAVVAQLVEALNNADPKAKGILNPPSMMEAVHQSLAIDIEKNCAEASKERFLLITNDLPIELTDDIKGRLDDIVNGIEADAAAQIQDHRLPSSLGAETLSTIESNLTLQREKVTAQNDSLLAEIKATAEENRRTATAAIEPIIKVAKDAIKRQTNDRFGPMASSKDSSTMQHLKSELEREVTDLARSAITATMASDEATADIAYREALGMYFKAAAMKQVQTLIAAQKKEFDIINNRAEAKEKEAEKQRKLRAAIKKEKEAAVAKAAEEARLAEEKFLAEQRRAREQAKRRQAEQQRILKAEQQRLREAQRQREAQMLREQQEREQERERQSQQREAEHAAQRRRDAAVVAAAEARAAASAARSYSSYGGGGYSGGGGGGGYSGGGGGGGGGGRRCNDGSRDMRCKENKGYSKYG